MKKFLLVVFVGTVLVLNVYGIANEIMTEDIQEIDHIEETTISVYME